MPEKQEAIVYKDRTGYWAVEDKKTHQRVGGLHSTEFDAYKYANWQGYVVC